MLTKYCYDLDAASSQFRGGGGKVLPLAGYGTEKLPKTVYCKLHICVHVFSTSTGMI